MFKLAEIFGTKTTIEMVVSDYQDSLLLQNTGDIVKLQPQDLTLTKADEQNLNHHEFCKRYHQLVDFIYAAYAKKLKLPVSVSQIPTQGDQQDEWLPIKESLDIKYTSGYYGQAWINHYLKQIVVVSAGTKIEMPSLVTDSFGEIATWLKEITGNIVNIAEDLVNDAMIWAKTAPYQFQHGIVKFVDGLIIDLATKVDLQEYKICFTGHSLGGVLSELAVAHMMSNNPELFKDIQAVSFDNPGSKPHVEQYLGSRQVNEQNDFIGIDEVKDHCINFNHKKNWLNSVHEQTGKVYPVTASDDAPPMGFLSKFFLIGEFLNTINHHDKINFKQARSFEQTEDWPHGSFNQYLWNQANSAMQGLSNIKNSVTSTLSDCYEAVDLFCQGLDPNFYDDMEFN